MKHASDRQLLDLLALGPPGEGELAGHLDCCAECRARLERFAETWEVLGHLEAAPASVDLAERIVQAAAEPAPASPAERSENASGDRLLFIAPRPGEERGQGR